MAEKRLIHEELAAEDRRLNGIMEAEREKGLEFQEELERRRKQELIRWAAPSSLSPFPLSLSPFPFSLFPFPPFPFPFFSLFLSFLFFPFSFFFPLSLLFPSFPHSQHQAGGAQADGAALGAAGAEGRAEIPGGPEGPGAPGADEEGGSGGARFQGEFGKGSEGLNRPPLGLGTARGRIGALLTWGTRWHRQEGTRSHRGLREEEEGEDPRE